MTLSAKNIIAVFSCLLCIFTASAQYPDAEVSLVEQSGDQATFRIICAQKKGGDALDESVIGCFNVILTRGVAGLHDGQPIVSDLPSAIEDRFFQEGIFNRYIVGKPAKENETKVNHVKQVTSRMTVRVDQLAKYMASIKNVTINPAWSGAQSPKVTAALNPTVVVVPYVKGDDNGFAAMKKVLEDSPATAQVVSDLSGLFAQNGYRTADLLTILANSKTSDVMNDGVQDDIHSTVLRQLPGDIIVTVNPVVTTNSGNVSSCTLTIDAVEKQTAVKLAAKSFASGEYRTSNQAELVSFAMKKVKKDFFDDINAAFKRMVGEGRRMTLEFNLSQDVADWDFDSPTPEGDNEFMDVLETFLADNSCGGVYDMGVSSDKFISANINIPIWNAEKGRGYTTSNFASALRKFLRKELGDAYKVSVTSMGQKIIITIK